MYAVVETPRVEIFIILSDRGIALHLEYKSPNLHCSGDVLDLMIREQTCIKNALLGTTRCSSKLTATNIISSSSSVELG